MSHPSSLSWFRFHSRDLGFFPWLSFRAHLLRCGECRQRCQREIAERAEFEGVVPAPRAGLALRLAMPLFAVAACLVVWQVSVRRDGSLSGAVALNDEPETFRPKGSPRLRGDENDGPPRLRGDENDGMSVFELVVVRSGEESLLGAQCRAGDALQARFTSAVRPQIMIVGVDPHQTARVLFPLDGETSQAVASGPNLVPNSWVLDAEPGRERFVAFFSEQPLRAEDARRAALSERPELTGATVVVHDCVKALR